MKCQLCQREAEPDQELCRYHGAARTALRAGFEVWREAYGEMAWEEYLNRVKDLESTGDWVKEVIESERAMGRDKK